MSINLPGSQSEGRRVDGDRLQIVLTWDDGPDGRTAPEIAELGERAAVPIELYWCGANMLRADVREALRVRTAHGVPQTGDGCPVSWLSWLDAQRGTRPREAFVETILDPVACDVGRQLRAIWGPAGLGARVGYHGITHNAPHTPAHPASLSEAALIEELTFFELLVRGVCAAPEFELKLGRTPYGAGLCLPYQSPARRFEAASERLTRAGRAFRRDFVWQGWDVDTKDYFYEGSIEEGELVACAIERAVRSSLPVVRILMHERCYNGRSAALRRIFRQVVAQTHRLAVYGPATNSETRASVFREGPCWSAEAADELLRAGARIEQPSERVAMYARTFAEIGTPYMDRSQEKTCDDRMTFEGFDRLSFVWTVLSMATSDCLTECYQRRSQLLRAESVRDPASSVDAVTAVSNGRTAVKNVTEVLWHATFSESHELRQPAVDAPGRDELADLRHGSYGAGFPVSELWRIVPFLKTGDVVLLYATEDGPIDRIAHGGIVIVADRADGGGVTSLIHCEPRTVGRPDGRRAGVSFVRGRSPGDPEVIDDSDEPMPLAAFLWENAARWHSAFVVRTDATPHGAMDDGAPKR